MSILPMSLSIPATPQSLSSSKFLSCGPIWNQSFCLTKKLSHFSLKTTPIRMGGGPRTFPGGVSKWQWKRMQAKKAKQLLKARLARERQIYEMRKRAELKAAVSELERPWEAVEKPPNLFSVSADEQLKVLADRFQKPGGLDLWTDNDGPELFRPDNNLPSSRFFPKGVVHSIKPYRKAEQLDTSLEEFEDFDIEDDSDSGRVGENVGEMGLERKGGNSRSSQGGMSRGGNVRGIEPRSKNGLTKEGENQNLNGKFRKKTSRRVHASYSEGVSSGNAGFLERDDRSSGPAGSSREYRRSSGPAGSSREFRRSSGPAVSSREFRRSSGPAGSSREFGRSSGPAGSSREFRKSNSVKKGQNVNSDVFDLNLQDDGSYGFELY